MNTFIKKFCKGLWVGLLAVMMAVPAVMAQPAGGPGPDDMPPEKGKKHMERMFEKLGLSDEQKTALEENREKHHGEFKELMGKMRQKREELRAELEKPELDIARVTAVHNELKAAMAVMEDHHLQSILEIRKILTPEQFVKFQAMMPDKKGRRGSEERREKRKEVRE